MDDWTLQKLKEWEVPENIINNFREEEIDKKSLLNLTQEMLKELIPKMGLRANIYKYILLEKQTKQQIPEDTVDTDVDNIASITNINNIDINEIHTFDIIDVEQSVIIYNDDNESISQFIGNKLKPKVNYSFYFKNNIIILL